MSRRPPIQHFFQGYGQNAKASVLSAPAGKQLKVLFLDAQNRSGATIDVGFAIKLAATSWDEGKIIAADTPDFTSQGATVKAGSAITIFTTVNNDGYLIQADRPFNVFGFNVVQGESGSPVYTYQYFNGTAYATLSGISLPTAYAAGTVYASFQAPIDWAVGTTAAVGGSTTLYSILVRATTASGQAVTANDLWVGKFLYFREGVVDNGSISYSPALAEQASLVLESNQSILPYFGGTASAQNQVSGLYAISD